VLGGASIWQESGRQGACNEIEDKCLVSSTSPAALLGWCVLGDPSLPEKNTCHNPPAGEYEKMKHVVDVAHAKPDKPE